MRRILCLTTFLITPAKIVSHKCTPRVARPDTSIASSINLAECPCKRAVLPASIDSSRASTTSWSDAVTRGVASGGWLTTAGGWAGPEQRRPQEAGRWGLKAATHGRKCWSAEAILFWAAGAPSCSFGFSTKLFGRQGLILSFRALANSWRGSPAQEVCSCRHRGSWERAQAALQSGLIHMSHLPSFCLQGVPHLTHLLRG